MSKRKLYPDECPVFAYGEMTLTGIPWLANINGNHAKTVRKTIHMHRSTSEPDNGIISVMDDGDEYLVRPLTPAAVEMWEHVAGKRWKPWEIWIRRMFGGDNG